MIMTCIVSILLIFPFLIGYAQECVHHCPPIHITASRVSSSLAAETRDLDILTREEISRLPVHSVPELLQYMGGIDMQQRSVSGIQADFSLRGSSFEQVLILLNGVRLNDAQTGHHNADIPLNIEDIDRIEILHGHASSIYGPDGYGGVINVITRASNCNQSSIQLGTGSFGTIQSGFSQALKLGTLGTHWTIKHSRSDGYRPVTDYKTTSLSHVSQWNTIHHVMKLTAGAAVKDYGANDFYADFPSRENTESLLGILYYEYKPQRNLNYTARLHIRRHEDDFILDIQNPDDFRNHHTSRTLGAEGALMFHLIRDLECAIGIEYLIESLKSTNLGDRKQQRIGFYSEMVKPVFKRGVINAGIRIDDHDSWELQVSPSLNVGIQILNNFQWRAAVGRIFRAPTFTERYYHSPANLGNPDLRPEHGWNIETGLDFQYAGFIIGTTLFQRNEKDRIDWIADQFGDPWQSVNIGKLKTTGISVNILKNLSGLMSWEMDYATLNQIQPAQDYLSKYQSRLLRHHVNGRLYIQGPWNSTQTWNLIWKERQKDTAYWRLDVKWSCIYKYMQFHIDGMNLLDTQYQEIVDVPMPGRHFMVGVKTDIHY